MTYFRHCSWNALPHGVGARAHADAAVRPPRTPGPGRRGARTAARTPAHAHARQLRGGADGRRGPRPRARPPGQPVQPLRPAGAGRRYHPVQHPARPRSAEVGAAR